MGFERFTMFDNWGEIFDELSDDDAIALFRGMYRYAFYDIEPEYPKGSVVSLTWKAIKPNIDSSGKAATSGGKKGKSSSPKDTPSEVPSEAPSKQKEGKGRGKEEKKNLPLEEDSSSSTSGGAAVAGAPPPSSMDCPTCDVPMKRTNTMVSGTDRHYWRCSLCGTEVAEC